MKSLNTLLNLVLLVAVTFLFYREFSSTEGAEAQAEEAANFSEKDFSQLRMAYINYDSLVSRYAYHDELKSKLEKRAKELEADLAQKTKVFQGNVQVLQERAGSLSEEQLQQAQLELQQKQQELMLYQEQKRRELTEEEQALTALLREDLDTVLTVVKKEYQLDLIFSYDRSSDLLSAAEDLNITETVLARLNERYEAGKAKMDSLDNASN